MKWSQLLWLCFCTHWDSNKAHSLHELELSGGIPVDMTDRLGIANLPFVPLGALPPHPLSFCHMFCDMLFLPALRGKNGWTAQIFSYGLQSLDSETPCLCLAETIFHPKDKSLIHSLVTGESKPDGSHLPYFLS